MITAADDNGPGRFARDEWRCAAGKPVVLLVEILPSPGRANLPAHHHHRPRAPPLGCRLYERTVITALRSWLSRAGAASAQVTPVLRQTPEAGDVTVYCSSGD